MMATARRGRDRRGRGIALALALALVAGCSAPAPVAEPEASTAAARASAPPPRAPGDELLPDGESLKQYYAGVERDLVRSGRMRRDVAPPDMPFSDQDLVRDFVRVALHDEYTDVGGKFLHAEQSALLRRWNKPVRVAVMTGTSATPEDAARDRGNVAAFTARLAHLTGLDMALSQGPDVNFLVLFMTSAERAAFADEVRQTYPDFAPAVLSAMHDATINNFCITYSFYDKTDPSLYSAVIVLIRAEHPAFTKLSCVQEEMSQAMGLPNDSPEARPSLYNDNLEFALLTEHDAMLLRMLYDPRLRPGMTAAEAAPLLPAIAADARAAEERDTGVTVAKN